MIDPNFAGVISVVVIFISIKFLMKNLNNRKIISLNLATVCLQFIYIVLSGSRTAQISLLACMLCGVFFMIYYKSTKKILVKLVVSGCLALTFTGITYGVIGVTESFIPNVVNFISKNVDRRIGLDNEKLSLERADVTQKDDISNNRFALWKSSFEIFQSSPIVGSSPRNMIPYAQEHLPDTFIATKGQTSHNFVFFLLATTGLLGTLPLLIFLVIKIFQSLQWLFIAKFDGYKEYLFNHLILLAVLFSALFLTELVLVNRLGSFIFWLYLGVVVNSNYKIKKVMKK